jgi:hypothetical protein
MYFHAFSTLSLCSVDIRERDPNAAKRWSDETVFSNRAYFLFDKLPGELAVQNAKDSDTGKCLLKRLQSKYQYLSALSHFFQVFTDVVWISK